MSYGCPECGLWWFMARKRLTKVVARTIKFVDVMQSIRKPIAKPGHVHNDDKQYSRRNKSWLHEK